MTLSFLYRGNAELCSAMAAAAKSEEIRLQWIELAEHWHHKAELDESSAGVINDQDRHTKLSMRAASERAKASQEQDVSHVSILAPTLVPAEEPSEHSEQPRPGQQDSPKEVVERGPDDGWTPRKHSEQSRPSQQAFPKEVVEREPEDEWTKLLAEIRPK